MQFILILNFKIKTTVLNKKNIMKLKLTTFLSIITFAVNAQETENNMWSAGRPDGHAPVVVMGDHMHGKGNWMFSYRYMYMNMEDLKSGTNNATIANALTNYMVTPTRMPMNMHMLGAMYAPSNKMTLMAMVSTINMEMDHNTRMGGTFTTKSNGFGDVKLAALYKFLNKNKQTLHGKIGVSIPTGSITKSDITPASTRNATELPYPMQIGSGTFDGDLAITYLHQKEILSFGSQLNAVVRFRKNNRDYRLGNRYNFNNWLAVKTLKWLSISARVEGVLVKEIKGADANLNPMMVITADTNNSGGEIINSALGFNIYIPKGTLRNIRFGFEYGQPIYQKLNGIQLKNKETISLGVQYSL